jgi:hypothetical protein
MHFRLLVAGLELGPFVFAGVLLCIFFLRRAVWRRNKRLRRKRWGFYPSTFALGIAFQMVQLFTEPGPKHVIAKKLEDLADEDGDGDPESPTKQLDRQLRKIRRGEEVGVLNVPLKCPDAKDR